MKKTLIKIYQALLIVLINLFFLLLIQRLPVTKTSYIESLASVVAQISGDAPYIEQVDTACAVLRLSSGENLEATIRSLGIFTAPISQKNRTAAAEAIQTENSFP